MKDTSTNRRSDKSSERSQFVYRALEESWAQWLGTSEKQVFLHSSHSEMTKRSRQKATRDQVLEAGLQLLVNEAEWEVDATKENYYLYNNFVPKPKDTNQQKRKQRQKSRHKGSQGEPVNYIPFTVFLYLFYGQSSVLSMPREESN